MLATQVIAETLSSVPSSPSLEVPAVLNVLLVIPMGCFLLL